MSRRGDISNKIIHFTKGSHEEAFDSLSKIIKDRFIASSNAKVKGRHNCVCFTEAPVESLRSGFVNENNFSRYQPFGIIFEKKYIFKKGGRPVIYQTDEEYNLLPPQLQWRHVRYEPGLIDFTWEREWRISCDVLDFKPSEVAIIVPNKNWGDLLRKEHDLQQEMMVEIYSTIIEHSLAELYREEFPWKLVYFE